MLPLFAKLTAGLELLSGAVEVAMPIVKSRLRVKPNKGSVVVVDNVDADLAAKLKAFETEAVHTTLLQLQQSMALILRSQAKLGEKVDALTDQVVHSSTATEQLTNEVGELLEMVRDSMEEYEDDEVSEAKQLFGYSSLNNKAAVADSSDETEEKDASEDDDATFEVEATGEETKEEEAEDEVLEASPEEDPSPVEETDKKSEVDAKTKAVRASEEKRKNFLRKLN
jgi:hypothetical protein